MTSMTVDDEYMIYRTAGDEPLMTEFRFDSMANDRQSEQGSCVVTGIAPDRVWVETLRTAFWHLSCRVSRMVK
jgi:hypothetical protein